MTQDNPSPFPKQSVWAVLGLSFLTAGFYFPFWLRKYTRIINRLLPDSQIASWWFPVCILVAILNLGMVIPEVLTNDHPLALGIDRIIEKIDVILTYTWIFKIRNRMNILLQAQPKQDRWFHGAWTFLFGILYLQYKVNLLHEQAAKGVEQNTPELRR